MLRDDEKSQEFKKSLIKKVQTYTNPTSDGNNRVSLAVGRFRQGYGLWLINLESEMGMRT